MTTFIRSAFKGGSVGAMLKKDSVVSPKVAGILPVIYEMNNKSKHINLSLRNDKLKQIKNFEATRKRL